MTNTKPRTEEWKKAQSERSKIMWANPEWRAKQISNHKKLAELRGSEWFSRISKLASQEKTVAPEVREWNSHKKYRYGIDYATYQTLVETSQGKCSICGTECKLDIDHNHTTKQVRGLVCRRCNLGLVYLDDKKWLKLALYYLGRTMGEEAFL